MGAGFVRSRWAITDCWICLGEMEGDCTLSDSDEVSDPLNYSTPIVRLTICFPTKLIP
jgi:hypothetical protein